MNSAACLLQLCAFVVLYYLTGFTNYSIANTEPQNQSLSETAELLTNLDCSDTQIKLLDTAFQTASKIPIEPHIKDRSRSQENVVQACLELDQPKRAFKYARQIANWRKGACFADIAFYCAGRGIDQPVEPLLQEAETVSKETEDWRTDNIRVKIAQTYASVGKTILAASYENNVEPSEQGKVIQVQAKQIDDESFAAIQKNLQTLIASGNFDVINNSLLAYAELYDRFYEDQNRRAQIISTIKESWKPQPILNRIDLLHHFADTALQHSDSQTALQHLSDIESYVEAYDWPLEAHVPILARLAKSLHQSGEIEKANTVADTALALYQEKGKQIVNIYRAGALRPLAEAFQIMGDQEKALTIYKRAIEEGMENPNSRPRAEDLSATCTSMALHQVEPDEQLWSRIQGIQKGLSDPW